MDTIRIFLEDIKSFFSSGSVVGVDIGTTSIKLAKLRKSRERIILENYGFLETREYLDRGNAALQASSLKVNPTLLAELLKLLAREAGLTNLQAVASIPSFAAFFSPLDLPAMTPAETAKAILFQARQYIPLPPDEVTLDWSKVGETENSAGGRTQKILLTAIPKETINLYQKAFKLAKFSLAGLETEAQALARALTNRPGVSLVIDIGGESTTIAVAAQGVLRLASQADYAGFTLTQALARSLNLNPQRAEDLKKLRGLSENRGERELSVALYPFLDIILQEARRVKNLYERDSSAVPISEIVLSGGGSEMAGLAAYVSARLGLPVGFPEPLAVLDYPAGLAPAVPSLNRKLAVALGLGFGKLNPFSRSEA